MTRHTKIPPLVKGRQKITARYLNYIRSAIQQIGLQKGEWITGPSGDHVPPFSIGHRIASGTHYFSAWFGYVCEIDRTTLSGTDAITLHQASNVTNDGGYVSEHAITEDEALFVKVTETANGAIDTVEIVVDADDTASDNITCLYYYKLASLKDNGSGVLGVVEFLSGSHIYHETGLTADHRIMGCPVWDEGLQDYVDGPQYTRLAFVSGRLAGIDETTETRALSANVSEVEITSICT